MQRQSDFSPEERAFLADLKLHGAPLCPLPAELQALESGVLPDATKARIQEHVRHCGICQMMVEDLPNVGEGNPTSEEESRVRARVFREAKSVQVGTKWLWRLVPAFGLVLVIMIVANWFYFARRSHQKYALNIDNDASVGQPVPDAFQMDRPAAVMPGILVWRGEDQDQGLEAGLRKALDSYRSGNDAVAQSQLEALVAQYPRSAESYFYLGICQLLLEQDAGAVTSLQKARQLAGEPLASAASWYLTVALVRSGDRGHAEEIVKKICQSSSPYQKRGCKGLDELSRRRRSQP